MKEHNPLDLSIIDIPQQDTLKENIFEKPNKDVCLIDKLTP